MYISNVLSLLPLVALAKAAAIPEYSAPAPEVDESTVYDAIVVGGGPSGLSAVSGLARVRRNVLLIDSGEYRNEATRHMHDVIGLDGKKLQLSDANKGRNTDEHPGVTPAYYRWLARELISDYKTVSLTNGTVTGIQAGTSNVTSFTVQATLPSGEKTLTARKIVLGTGLKDDLPSTPGLQDNWGKGIYWCPWCDGNEHADQALGLLGPLEDIPGLVREVATLNSDVVAFANGTDTPEARAATEASFPDWEEYLKISNVTVYNQTITSITRLRDGHNASADPSLATSPEYDLFRVDLDDGTSVERAAFFVSFPDEQKSTVGEDLGITLYGGRLYANQDKGLTTNIAGTYAIGDANSDNVTNVPHAIYTGKKAAVYAHGE